MHSKQWAKPKKWEKHSSSLFQHEHHFIVALLLTKMRFIEYLNGNEVSIEWVFCIVYAQKTTTQNYEMKQQKIIKVYKYTYL